MTDAPAAYVIFTADLYADATDAEADAMRPKSGEWQLTEGDEQYPYDYMADEGAGDRWRDGKHRKWVAELSAEEFEKFLDDEFGLTVEEARERGENTLGSITEFGHLPAYALNTDGMDWNIGGVTRVIETRAYVTDRCFFLPA